MVREFDGRQIDLEVREVRGPGGVRKLEPRAAAVLNTLLNRSGIVVSRSELLNACWPEGEGSDEALSQAVAQLRRALDDDPRSPRFVRTIHKTGYQWVARAAQPIVRLDEAPVPVRSAHLPARAGPRMALAATVVMVLLIGAGVVGLTRQGLRSTADRAFVAAGGRIDHSTQRIEEAGKVMELETVHRRPPPPS